MHPLTIDQLAREHIATLHREARNTALGRTAPGAASRPVRHWADRVLRMPHVRERGGLRRAITALLRPTGA